jgi:D-alanine-D-alanine ligase and related ATP-grasp enzymes
LYLSGLLVVHPADKEEKKRMRDSIEKKTAEAYTIAVFFGGCSTEYEVSLQSACSVILNIDPDRYRLVLIGIDRETGKWFWYRGGIEKITRDCWQNMEDCTPVFPSVDRTVHGICCLEGTELRNISLDAALPILHGKNGEDGTLQGLLELMGVPVIGCGLLSSALCMDKELAHQIVRMGKIKTARSVVLEYFGKNCPLAGSIPEEGSPAKDVHGEKLWMKDVSGEICMGAGPEEICAKAREIGYPLFVKPVRSGSSFGITKVQSEEQLFPAVKEAFRHDSTVILEEMIDGFEVGCAVLGTDAPIIGEVDEIELSDGFFDYTEKYTLKTSSIHVPARISPEKAEEIKETALKIYQMLKCSDFARVDMFLTPDGEIYFNEVNTIPGFTSHSRYPNMLKEAGLTFGGVIERLLANAGL